MKAFLHLFYKNGSFSLIILAILLLNFELKAQVLVQDFDDLHTLNQFQSTNPDVGQVDKINLNPAANGIHVFSLGSSGTDKFLQIEKVSRVIRHFDRTTGINNEPFLRISFDFSVLSASSSGKFGAFFIGNNLNENSFFPDREERWAQIGIYANSDGSFQLTHEILFPDGNVFEIARTPAFSGENRVSLVMSNSDEENPLVYTGPDGSPDLISKGQVHIWVGENYKLVGPALRGKNSSINAVKFLLWNTTQVASAQMDNFSITKDVEIDFLPVDLLSFSARVMEEDIQLLWSTASEINSSHFNIERSYDGKKFVRVGRVKAIEKSNEKVNYTFVDKLAARDLAGTIYYRLHQVDLDGASEYSPLSQVVLPGLNSLAGKAFPNPFREQLNVRVLTDKSTYMNFRLFTLHGNVVWEGRQLFEAQGQDQIYPIPCSEKLAVGTYLLEISNEQKVSRLRVVKY